MYNYDYSLLNYLYWKIILVTNFADDGPNDLWKYSP